MAILFGFPGAGAGIHVFEIWKDRLGDDLEFREILHNRRLGKQYCQTMAEAAGICAGEVLSFAKDETELWFFGHCMGAAMAYETAKLLAKEHGVFIRGLFVSAANSPDVPIEDGISHWDDKAFAEEIRSHGTFPEEFFANPALLKLFLPKIRADYRLIEEYCDKEPYVLDGPIAGFFGADDDSVREEGIAGWANYTAGGFQRFYFPGSHYFYYDHQEEIIAKIRELIGEFRAKDAAKRRTCMEEIIIRLLAETMEMDVKDVSWNRETDILNDIGIDSLQLVRFLMRLEEELNITIDYEALTFDDLATIGSLEKFLARFVQQ